MTGMDVVELPRKVFLETIDGVRDVFLPAHLIQNKQKWLHSVACEPSRINRLKSGGLFCFVLMFRAMCSAT
jgi:hypothetical protein